MKTTAFDVVNHRKNEIEMCWRDEVLNKRYYTDEFYPPSQKSSDDDRTQSACSGRKIRYDDRLPVIYPPRKCQSAETAEQTMVPPSGVATKSLERNNIPERDEHIKSVQGKARILSKEERMARTEITEKENGCKEELERGLARLERTVRERAEARTKIGEKLKQCQKKEKSQRGVIDWDLENEIGALDKKMKHQKRLLLRKEGRPQKENSPMAQNKDAPKYIVKLHSPADLETSELMYSYMIKNQKCSEWDHVIVDHYSGHDLLRDHIQRFYTPFKTSQLTIWDKEDALRFMTLLSRLYENSESELTEIRIQIAKDMDEKYKDQISARIAMNYFHNTCGYGEGRFDIQTYDKLHGDECQMISVTIDYFVHLFHVVISGKVDELQHILHPDAPIWGGKIPDVILQEEIGRLERCVAVVQKDLEYTVELKTECLASTMEGKSDMEQVMDQVRAEMEQEMEQLDSPRVIAKEQTGEQIIKEKAKVLSKMEREGRGEGVVREARERRKLEQRRTLPFVIHHLEELRLGFADLKIIRIIRDWIDLRRGSGGTICIVIDEIDGHQLLETLLTQFDDITLEKKMVSQYKIHASRGGRAQPEIRWRYEIVPTLNQKPDNEAESTNSPGRSSRIDSKRSSGKKGGKKRK